VGRIRALIDENEIGSPRYINITLFRNQTPQYSNVRKAGDENGGDFRICEEIGRFNAVLRFLARPPASEPSLGPFSSTAWPLV
jgi:predicted dehydrogenase